MILQDVRSFAEGVWVGCNDTARTIHSAITGEAIARAGNDKLDVAGMLEYAKNVGGKKLRETSFHTRAKILKAIAQSLNAQKKALYDISFSTGATQKDHLIDIDGGIGALFAYCSMARRDLPNSNIYLDGQVELLSRNGTFLGQHVCTSLQGVAIHVNAFNFPVWGMLEKLAPAFLAGVPAIIKPATATSHVTELCVRIILDSGLLPEGALQLVSGRLGDMLDHLTSQDIVSFTGSADTALLLRSHPKILSNATRFIAEQDSLNASILGPDAVLGTVEFDLFTKEVLREITTKAGQKCTAIRRILVSEHQIEPVIERLKSELSKVITGDPRLESTGMGALVSQSQKQDVLSKIRLLEEDTEFIVGEPGSFLIEGQELQNGAFVPPTLLYCNDPDRAKYVHDVEAFGPVSTIMAYRDISHASTLLNNGRGSLVASVITNDVDIAREITIKSASFHGRLYFNNRVSMHESTGHGSPLPHMIHGGPGRAGGGEEMGGIRGVLNYMQRTGIQGSPEFLSQIGGKWVQGAPEVTGPDHPFKRKFSELQIGETIVTGLRRISIEDIEHFASFTGDKFYAHMDEEAAKRNPFFPGRVAHGYLILSFAAGLFVEPNEGPVLANTGLDNLRFMKPVQAGESIKVRITVKDKKIRNEKYGEVRWHVSIKNQDDELVAGYELITWNAV